MKSGQWMTFAYNSKSNTDEFSDRTFPENINIVIINKFASSSYGRGSNILEILTLA